MAGISKMRWQWGVAAGLGAVALFLVGEALYRAALPDAEMQAPAETQSAEAGAAEESESAEVVSEAPLFEFARVESDGAAQLAGRGRPGDVLEIILDGEVIAEAEVGADGAFAALIDIAPSQTAQSLSLRTKGEGSESAQSVIVAPTALAKTEDAGANGAEAEAEDTAAPDEPAARPAVIVADAEGTRLVQAPQPQVMSQVALDAISYSEGGDVALEGRAPEGGFVRVYLDNRPVATQPVAEGGGWRTELPDVDSGIYTLRVDKVDAQGEVQSRVETPFKREEAEAVSDAGEDVRLVTVQPGATLWAIARARFGEGTQYVQIYEANKDRIRDPDLIYPGQVFDIPE